jgi:hypothetical protein
MYRERTRRARSTRLLSTVLPKTLITLLITGASAMLRDDAAQRRCRKSLYPSAAEAVLKGTRISRSTSSREIALWKATQDSRRGPLRGSASPQAARTAIGKSKTMTCRMSSNVVVVGTGRYAQWTSVRAGSGSPVRDTLGPP